MVKKILDDMREGCECKNIGYCPLEVFLKSIDPRFLEQHKCVEIFKYEESEKAGKDIGLDKAYKLWVERGYAKKFAAVYKEGMRPREIYDKVVSSSC